MTQDLYYYETGYFDPALGYFVYTADAESLEAGSFTMTAAVGVIKSAEVSLSSEFTQTAVISHIEGADLFAMTNASLAAEVSRIRDNNVAVTAAFTQVTAGAKFIHFSSDQNIDTTISVANLRVRFNEAAVSAAFSLTADIEMIPGGDVLEGAAALVSHFDIDAKGTRKQNIIDCDVSAEFSVSADGNRLRGLESTLLETSTSNVTDVSVTRTADSSMTANASLTAVISHVEGADLSAFTNAALAADVEVVKDQSAALSAASSATIDASAIIRPSYDADPLELFANTQVTAQARRFAGISSALSSTATVTASNQITRSAAAELASAATVTAVINEVVQLQAALSSNSSLSAVISHIEGADLSAFTNAALAADVEVVKTAIASLTSQATQTAVGNKTADAVSTLAANVTLAASVEKFKFASISLTSQSQLTVSGFITNKRPRNLVQTGSQITTSTTEKLLGTHSLYIPDAAGSSDFVRTNATSDFTIPSSTDFIIEFYFRPSQFAIGNFISIVDNGDNQQLGLGRYNIADNANQPSIRAQWVDVNNQSQSQNHTTVLSGIISGNDDWIYVRFARSSTSLTLTLRSRNNSTQIWSSASTVTRTYSGQIGYSLTNLRLKFGHPSTIGFGGYIDEFYIAKGTGTTQQFISGAPERNVLGNDPTTLALYHFDGDYLDDINGISRATAALSTAFTQSAQAQATTNLAAVIASTATQVTQANANFATGVNLSANGFVASIVGRIRPEVADLTATTAVSVNAGKQVVTSAALSAATTLSATALRIQRSAVTVSAATSVDATAVRTRATAAALTTMSTVNAIARKTAKTTAALTTTSTVFARPDDIHCQLIYGAGNTSGYITSDGIDIRTTITGGFTSVQSNFWIKLENALTSGQKITIYSSGSNQIYLQRGGTYPDGSSVGSNTYVIYTAITVTWWQQSAPLTYVKYIDQRFYSINLGTDFDPTEWHNVLIPLTLGARVDDVENAGLVMSYSNVIRVDGATGTTFNNFDATLTSQQGTQNTYAAPTSQNAAKGGQWGAASNPTTVYLDQVWVLNDSGSVPVSDFYNNGFQTVINNGLTQSAKQGQVWLPFGTLLDRASTAPTWNYTANNRVIPGLVKEGNASISSAVTQTTIGVRARQYSASITSQSTLTATVLRIKKSAVTLTSQVTASTIGTRIARLVSNLTTTAALSSPINRQRPGQAVLTSTATVTPIGIKVTVTQATLAASASLSCAPNRRRGVVSQVDAATTITTDAIKTSRAQALLEVNAFTFDASVKTGQGFVDCRTTATLAANARIITGSEANLTAQATVEATPWNVVVGGATISSSATQETIPTYLRRNESIMVARATMTVNAGKIARTGAQATSNAQATVTTNNSRLRGITSTPTARFTQTSNNKVLRLATANLVTRATILFIPGVLVRVEANLLCNGFVMTAGRVIHLDPFLQLKIAAETRTLTPIEETRLILIEEETRVNKIKGYPL